MFLLRQIPKEASWLHESGERGAVILLVALCLTAIFGMLALSVDGGVLFQRQQALRYSLDTGVIRGLRLLRQGETNLDKVRSTVETMTRLSLLSYGIHPTDLTGVEVQFSADNTSIQAHGQLWTPYRFAVAVPGTGYGRIQNARSAARYERTEVRVEPRSKGNIVAVLDISCSMWAPHTEVSEFVRSNGRKVRGGKRIHAVIAGLQKLITDGIEGKYLSVVTFDKTAVTRLAPTRINDEIEPGQTMSNRERAMSITYNLDNKHTRCNTRTSDGMLEGLINVQELLERPDAPDPEEIEYVLLTDGGATHQVTRAFPRLGWMTPQQTLRRLDAETFGRCDIGTSFVQGSTSAMKVAELVRRLGVRITVLAIGPLSEPIVQALKLISADGSVSAQFPCRALPTPHFLSREMLSGPPGIVVRAVSDLDTILQGISEGQYRVHSGPVHLIHPR